MREDVARSAFAGAGRETLVTKIELFDEWTTYEKLVANDYMHHRGFFAALAKEVDARLSEPLRVVDLGCGDCAPAVRLLKNFDIESYVGIDQSESALSRARANLASTGVPFDLRCGSMFEELSGLECSASLIISSYSLHHLERPEKQDILGECRRLLEPGGLLAIIDVFLEDSESRQAYLKRWESNARQKFSALAAQEVEDLLAHVHAEDRPETLATYRQIGEAEGFANFEALGRDAERLNGFVILY